MFMVCRFFNKVFFFFNFSFSPVLLLIQGTRNFKTALNSSGSCLDYITGMLLQEEYSRRSLFITDFFLPSHTVAASIQPPHPPHHLSKQQRDP